MKKQKLILPLLILLALVCLGGYYLLQRNGIINRTPSDSLSKELIKQADEEAETTDSEQRGENEDTEPGEPSTSGKLQAPTISTLEQSGDILIVRTVINNNVTSGSCSLKLTKGTATIDKQAAIGLVTSYYTCQGFDVPTSELSPGTWSASVSISSDGETATSTPRSIEIQ